MRRLAGTLLVAALLASCRTTGPAAGDAHAVSQRYVADGQQAMRDSKTDEAIDRFRKALAADGRNRDAMRALVEAHFRSGRIEAITRELERRVAVTPDDDVAHYGLGLAYFAKSAGSEQQAVEHLARAAALQPDVAEYHFRLGVVHLEAERFPEAVKSLSRARDLEPREARHYVPLALAMSRTGNRTGAVEALRAMLELNPDRKELEVARRVMARVNDSLREFPKVIEEQFQRGLQYMDRADAPQQAIVIFEEILEQFPDLAVVHSALGLAYERIDNAGRAVDEFRRALELAPEDARNHLYMADLYFAKERYDKAIEGYRAAIARDPLADSAYERLGSIALQRGDAVEASRWLKLLVVLRPDDLKARQSYGMALLTQGQYDAAEEQFKLVAAREPKNLEALLRLGMINAERQKRASDAEAARRYGDRAAEYFEKVLDQQPQNAFAARMLKSVKQ